MNIADIAALPPLRAGEGSAKIPWDDPDFSRRMLAEHLSQEHDRASRRADIIGAHADFVHRRLPQAPARVLDLACGPGLYTHLLAERGHDCTGVDFSPASIDYARKRAQEAGFAVNYRLADIRTHAPEAEAFDCVLLTFGECNVFAEAEAEALLGMCAGALRPGGFLLLEGHRFDAVRAAGLAPPAWRAFKRGVFFRQPPPLP